MGHHDHHVCRVEGMQYGRPEVFSFVAELHPIGRFGEEKF